MYTTPSDNDEQPENPPQKSRRASVPPRQSQSQPRYRYQPIDHLEHPEIPKIFVLHAILSKRPDTSLLNSMKMSQLAKTRRQATQNPRLVLVALLAIVCHSRPPINSRCSRKAVRRCMLHRPRHRRHQPIISSTRVLSVQCNNN